jgi:hypothetical protein
VSVWDHIIVLPESLVPGWDFGAVSSVCVASFFFPLAVGELWMFDICVFSLCSAGHWGLRIGGGARGEWVRGSEYEEAF